MILFVILPVINTVIRNMYMDQLIIIGRKWIGGVSYMMLPRIVTEGGH